MEGQNLVCPYCSTDMTPIELNGKVFCSNCGLTIANNSPEPTINIINPVQKTVSNVLTNAPEEVGFPVIPEVVESNQQSTVDDQEIDNSTSKTVKLTDTEPLIDYFGQFGGSETETEGVKLNVVTEEPIPLPPRPITEEAAKDLGITPEEPVLESKISNISIPSEEDFTEPTTGHEPVSSYVELANPGNEKETLEASGILLDILGNENNETKNAPTLSSPVANPGVSTDLPEVDPRVRKDDSMDVLDPIAEPEIPAETETKEEDDIYTLPSEIKVGLRKKKVKKETHKKNQPKPKSPEADIDPKTEKKIERLEELISDTPEPEISLTPEEAKHYDPDTIDIKDIGPTNEKSKIIKDYFSTAIEKDKTSLKTKTKKKKRKRSFRVAKITLVLIFTLIIIFVGGYLAYSYLNPVNAVQQSEEAANFTTISPTYVPEGYILTNDVYLDPEKTFQSNYIFANDKTKTLTYKQVQTSDTAGYISDYLLSEDASFVEKKVGDITITEVNKNNLIWSRDGFVFILETENYDLSSELLYKTAETVK